jgi:transcriptional regulator GlxA family with amidase domain
MVPRRIAFFVVDDGRVITAGAVSSALDLGVHLVGKYWGEERRAAVARAMHVEL